MELGGIYEMTTVIKIKDAPMYFGGDEKYPTFDSKNLFRQKIKRLIRARLIIGDIRNKEVDLQSLNQYISLELNILENYISILEFQKIFDIPSQDKSSFTKNYILNLDSESPFRFEYIILNYPINYQTFYIRKSSVDQFLNEYISVTELFKINEISEQRWLRRIREKGIKAIFLSREKRFITKNLYKLLTKDFDEYNESEYYSYKEFYEILGKPTNNVRYAIEEEYNIQPLMLKSKLYYKKQVVDDLKLRQDKLIVKAMTFKEAYEIAKSNGFNFDGRCIETKPMKNLLRPYFKHSKIYYLREDFNNWLEERKQKVEGSVFLKTKFDTFKYRLLIKNVDLNDLGLFTSKTWLEYINNKLNTSKANSDSIDGQISEYVYATKAIINLVGNTNKREIYSVTSNDINTLFNEIAKSHAQIIYLYISRVFHGLREKKMNAFDLNKINNPYKFDKETRDKSIYEYELFKKLFNYVKEISLHKEKAINDTLNIIAGEKPRKLKHYASSWLYVLLHLNNAWRNSDIIKFPHVNLSGTKIVDLNWMLENDLSDEDVDYIINQVFRTEFIISKTQVRNYFFCSDELKKPYATAIAICQLRSNVVNPLQDSIIDFNNKNNNFNDYRRKHFFEFFEDEEFHFTSRKINRSLISYVYVLLSKMQKGKAGLKTVQNMRGHLEQETTNFYVDIPESELNFLTRQLFSRSSFGFIYDTFLDVLQGVEIDREKRTIEIQYLDTFFGDIYKVEEIAGFLNVIQEDRKTILDRILSMGLEEALEFVNKIETEQLPSKQENVQCMYAETGCVKEGKGINCFDCAFSIPNYYALSALGASLEERFEGYLQSKNSQSKKTYYEQRKYARLFYIQLELWAQAINKFGLDVYNFIKFDRDEFRENTKKIESLKEKYQLSK